MRAEPVAVGARASPSTESLRIAVALCTYNGSAFIEEQLASIASQTRLPDSVVVVDDASKDDTVRIVRAFARRAPFRVRRSVNPENVGYVRNFETAITQCHGDLIVLCDQDDVWHPDKLIALESAFAEDDRLGLAFSDAELVDKDLEPFGRGLWEALHFTPAAQRTFRNGRALELLARGWWVTGATLAFRSTLRPLVLPIPPGVVHDGWIALLAAAVARVLPIGRRLIRYRQHGANQLGIRDGGLVERWRHHQRSSGQVIEALRWQAIQACQRLREHGVAQDRLAILDAAIEHFEARRDLPSQRLRRIRPILRELLRARYSGRYAGLPNAVRDLIA